jgi:hypothetical protein
MEKQQKFMNKLEKTEKNKEAANENEDWAVLPFDEAEDDARWSKLIEETDELIKEAEEMEAVHGPLLMENKLSDLKTSESEAEDNPF